MPSWSVNTCIPGPYLNINTVVPGMGCSMLKIKRSWDRLIFNMGIPLLARRYLYIETDPWLIKYSAMQHDYVRYIILRKSLSEYYFKEYSDLRHSELLSMVFLMCAYIYSCLNQYFGRFGALPMENMVHPAPRVFQLRCSNHILTWKKFWIYVIYLLMNISLGPKEDI